MSAADPTNRSERRPLTLDDLTALRTVADPQVSPDGRQVAFVIETMVPEANEVRSQIWLAPAEPGQAPRPLTTGKHQDQQPRWSPDGRTLAFVSNRTGSRQIWLLPLNGGEPRRLTNLPADVQSPVWSPDGQRLAFLTRGADRRGDPLPSEEKDPRKRVVRVRAHRHKLDGRGFFGPLRTHVWIVDLAGGAPTQVTDGPADDAEPAWSPDGRQLAFVSDRSPGCDWRFGGGAVHLVDLATGAARRLTPEGGRAAHPSWSPDGRMIAYVGSLDGDEASAIATRLWTVAVTPADGGPTPQCLTADLDRSVGQRPLGYLSPSPPAWSPDGESLLYLIGDGPSTHLVRNPRRGPRQPLSAGRRVVQSFTVDRAGQRAALLVTDAVTPAEVWLWDAATGARSLTAVNRDLLAQLRLNPPEDLHLTRPDGTAIDGWLLRPAVAREEPVPLLLSVHGGPHNYFGDGFSFDHHLYAAQGYAVLYGNPRGSGGGSEAFARAVCGDWGGADFLDLLALVDQVIARADPAIDPSRLAITGGSYGGYLTCWAITQTDRFAVAVAGACISNLISFFGTSDIGASWGLREFGGPPDERLDWYLARSPLTHAARVHTPLLLYHGEADLRCPIEQSEQFFTALLRRGQPVELLRVPEEPHGVLAGSPSHRVAVREAILEWLARYLR